MNFDALLGMTQRLNVSVEALAALAAYLRLRTEQRDPDPEVATLLQTVVTALGIDAATIESIPEPQLRVAVGVVRAFLRQAEDLIDSPDRPPGWTYDDPELLQSQGRASMLVAGLIARVAPTLHDLDARLRAEGARFLDIGTGVGLLAVAMCQAFPTHPGHRDRPVGAGTGVLERAGFADVAVIERTWSAPIQLVAGCAR